MKIITALLLLFCTKFVFAQDYQDYYANINRAKLSIVEDSLDKAINYYFKTFEQFDFVFARDSFNALEVASQNQDFDKMAYFFRRCLKQGIDFNFLQQDSSLSNFKETEMWDRILMDKDSLRMVYERNVNWEIRNEIKLMFTEDQNIRDLANKNRFNIFKQKKLKKQFEEIDHKLVLRIIEITKEYGFPGEKIIGLDDESMHPKIKTKNLTAGMPIVIFIHHYSQSNESYNNLLIDEVKKGNLFNEHFATISDFQYTYGDGVGKQDFCHSLMFNPKLDIEIINRNRNRIYLLSVEAAHELKIKNIITPKYYLY
jgi:hypothetical protein